MSEQTAGSSTAARGWDCHVHVFDAAAPVREGHYRPAHRPLALIEAQAATLGIGHLVLVQPSVYGTDNRLLREALAVDPGRHRGVVVLDDAVDEASGRVRAPDRAVAPQAQHMVVDVAAFAEQRDAVGLHAPPPIRCAMPGADAG